ncbi:MAG: tetratricopeptide repeat protein [Candidatus Latescibacteria bacterium]|nr:tetratricopeptide repeat protein [Candidatus Latescibacterota bacterium]NIO57402.1 tetratricopeptide repeat protein [Candidatus Latescibacterota bacterium]
MIPVIKAWLVEAPWMELLELLIDVMLKGAVFCAAAGIATLFLRRSSAFIRNKVWVFALVGLILLPAFSLLSPWWNLPIIPYLGSWGAGSQSPEYAKPDQGMFVGPPYAASPETPEAAGGSSGSMPISIPWYAWGILAWIAGGVFYLSWCLISHAGVRFIVRKAHPAKNEWNLLLGNLAEEINLRRKVRLLESEHVKAAITAGILNPVIVLPSDTKEWTENRRRLVLSHELAHVKRWDTLIETFALFVTVVYWFNPLVWLAVKQLRIERERDCDNAVLGTGAKPSDYAELLMNIAADLGGSVRPAWQLSTISQNSNLKDRLMSILNQKINRNRGSRRSAILAGVLVLMLVLPISASGLWNSQTEEKSQKEKKAKTEEMKKKEMHDKQKKMSGQDKLMEKWKQICTQDNSAACKVGMVIKKKGAEAGIKAFYEMKTAGDDYSFDESEFNTLGYVFLYHEKIDEAIAVFELNVKEYPQSWNVYDSLGEAYMAAKRYDDAVKNYETALKLNPQSESSKKALEKLKMVYKKQS